MESDQALLQFFQQLQGTTQQHAQAAQQANGSLAQLVKKQELENKKKQEDNKKKNADRQRKLRMEERQEMGKSRKGLSEFLRDKFKKDKREEGALEKFVKKALGIGAVIAGGAMLYKKFKEPIDKAFAKIGEMITKGIGELWKFIKGPLWDLTQKAMDVVLKGLKWALDKGLEILGNWLGGPLKEVVTEALKEWGKGIFGALGLGGTEQGLNRLINPQAAIRADLAGGMGFDEAFMWIGDQFESRGYRRDGTRRGGQGGKKQEDSAAIADLKARLALLKKLKKAMNAEREPLDYDPDLSAESKRNEWETITEKYNEQARDVVNKPLKKQGGGVVQASHPHTGSGWSVGNDYKGRPSIFNKPAAEAFVRMMKASKGVVRTSDITSSKRSPRHNRRVGGVPNSNHLGGNAVDIHGASKAWMKKHGIKYGFKNLNYSGHDGHFDFIGAQGSTTSRNERNEETSRSARPGTAEANANSPTSASNNSQGSAPDSPFGGLSNIGSSLLSGAGSAFGGMMNFLSGNFQMPDLSFLGGMGGFLTGFLGGIGDTFKGLFGGSESAGTTVSRTAQANVTRFNEAQGAYASKVGNKAFQQVIVVKRRPAVRAAADLAAKQSGVLELDLDATGVNSGVDPVLLIDEMYRQQQGASF